MPIYRDLSNLIIPKSVIKIKYNGGIEAFKHKYYTRKNHRNQEDNKLFSLANMNPDEFNIHSLVEHGLAFDIQKIESSDFSIINRYGRPHWDVDWLSDNNVFVWHKSAKENHINKVKFIEEGMTMDEIT